MVSHCCLVAVVSDSFLTPWTVACHAPLSKGFPRQEYWSGLPFPSPGDLLDPGINPTLDSGIKPTSPALQLDSSPIEPLGKLISYHSCLNPSMAPHPK